jgi:hypothetical protein
MNERKKETFPTHVFLVFKETFQGRKEEAITQTATSGGRDG